MVGPLREFACELLGVGPVALYHKFGSHADQTIAILGHYPAFDARLLVATL